MRVCHCFLLTIYLSICFSSVYLFVNSSVYLPISLFVHLSVRTLPWKTVDRRNPRWILWQSSRWTIVGLEPPSPKSQSWNPIQSWIQTLQVTNYKLQFTSHRDRSLESQYSPEYKHYKLQITSYNLQVTEIAVLKPNTVLNTNITSYKLQVTIYKSPRSQPWKPVHSWIQTLRKIQNKLFTTTKQIKIKFL